jgi:hypothetical protein
MGYSYDKAIEEMEYLEATTSDAIIIEFKDEILELVSKFSESGQSGGSAPYVAGAISEAVRSLCLHQPLSPITGEDSEWGDVSEYGDSGEHWYQNKRNSAIFKNGDGGNPYYLDGIIWQGPDKYDTYTGTAYLDDTLKEKVTSRQFIKLPFFSKSFYIDVVYNEITKEDAEKRGINYTQNDDGCTYTIIKDISQLDEVKQYYNFKTVN